MSRGEDGGGGGRGDGATGRRFTRKARNGGAGHARPEAAPRSTAAERPGRGALHGSVLLRLLLLAIGIAAGWWIAAQTHAGPPPSPTDWPATATPAATDPLTALTPEERSIIARSLNCRSGVTNDAKRRLVVEVTTGQLGKRRGADVVCLQDHGVHTFRKAQQLVRAYGPNACGYVSQTTGEKAGTTALVYPHGATDITLLSTRGRWTTADATVHGHRFRSTSGYMPSVASARRKFLTEIHDELQHTELPWVVAADWNFIPDPRSTSDKFGGLNTTGTDGRDEWQATESEFGLSDIAKCLGTARPTYIAQSKGIGTRLDRFYTNAAASSWATAAYATSTAGTGNKLDHLLISLELETGPIQLPPKRVRRLLPVVLSTPDYRVPVTQILQAGLRDWDDSAPPGEALQGLQKRCLAVYRKAERSWTSANGTRAREAAFLIQDKEEELALSGDDGEVRRSYQELVDAEQKSAAVETYGRQSAALNTRNRDLRSKDFYAQAARPRAESTIQALARFKPTTGTFDTSDLATDPTTAAAYAREFYVDLHRQRDMDTRAQDVMLSLAEPADLDMQRSMGADLTVHETSRSLRCMAGSRSPGPDGIPAELYQSHRHLWARILTKVFNRARREGALPPDLRLGTQVLLWKKNDRRLLSNYRSIVLLQRSYCVLSTALALRMRRAVVSQCRTSQRGFVPLRSISDNILECFDALEHAKRSNQRCAMVGQDLLKGFDMVNRFYCHRTVDHMLSSLMHPGVPAGAAHDGPGGGGAGDTTSGYDGGPRLVNGRGFGSWIRTLHYGALRRITINGVSSETFALVSGLAQGCSCSCCLFLLV